MPTDKQFTGHQAEGELYFAQARFYDPWTGQFTQADSIVPDPGNPQSLNRYSYVYNNPLRYTDPSGYCIVNVGPLNDACDAVGNFFTETIPGAWDDTTSALEQAYLRGQYYLDRFLQEAEAAEQWVRSRAIEAGRAAVASIGDVAETAIKETVEFAQSIPTLVNQGAETVTESVPAWPVVSNAIQVADILPLNLIPALAPYSMAFDIAAAVAAEIDIVTSGCPLANILTATGLNAVGLTVGLASGPVGVWAGASVGALTGPAAPVVAAAVYAGVQLGASAVEAEIYVINNLLLHTGESC